MQSRQSGERATRYVFKSWPQGQSRNVLNDSAIFPPGTPESRGPRARATISGENRHFVGVGRWRTIEDRNAGAKCSRWRIRVVARMLLGEISLDLFVCCRRALLCDVGENSSQRSKKLLNPHEGLPPPPPPLLRDDASPRPELQ